MLKIEIIGRIGKDATVNNYNGKNVINFSVAHSEKYKDSNGTEVNRTHWVECAYWVERTGVAQYLKKGTQVYVEGQPESKTYQASDGSHRASLACRVRKVELLGSANNTTSETTTNNQSTPFDDQEGQIAPSSKRPDDPDDPPF